MLFPFTHGKSMRASGKKRKIGEKEEESLQKKYLEIPNVMKHKEFSTVSTAQSESSETFNCNVSGDA